LTWQWTAHRVAVSAFLVFHLTATIIWVLPTCPLRVFAWEPVAYYILPLGLWQSWGMFAPDPVRDTNTLEAQVIDAKGLLHTFAFPKLSDYSKLGGIPRFRHSKYAANMSIDEFVLPRKFAMRHAVRTLRLPDDAFPMDVHLYYVVRPAPPIGCPPDPMTPTRNHVLGSVHFETPGEVRP
jgi:hypothetical protein